MAMWRRTAPIRPTQEMLNWPTAVSCSPGRPTMAARRSKPGGRQRQREIKKRERPERERIMMTIRIKLNVSGAALAAVAMMAAGLAGHASAQVAQPAAAAAAAAKQKTAGETFKNVTTASLKGLTVDDFMGTMGVISADLGLDCADCHPGAGTDKANFVIDTPQKITARKMIDMIAVI